MALTVNLMMSASPVEKIGKSLTTGGTYSCVLKDGTSILKPVLELRTSDPVYTYNYMQIADFSRYYFIDDIISLHNNLWEIHARVDVLETYKAQILANSAIVKRQQSQYNLYLDDPDFHAYNYERIQTLKFPNNDFHKALNYVLVVNGS